VVRFIRSSSNSSFEVSARYSKRRTTLDRMEEMIYNRWRPLDLRGKRARADGTPRGSRDEQQEES
jgi:hypothetical protein